MNIILILILIDILVYWREKLNFYSINHFIIINIKILNIKY